MASSLQGKELIAELIEVMHPEGDDAIDAQARAGRMARLFDKITAGPARIDSAKKPTEMLERLVKLEREAFGIDNSKGTDGGFEALLDKLGRS